MESYSVQAVLSAVDKNFTSSMGVADKSMNSLSQSANKTQTSVLDIAKGIGAFKLIGAGISMVKNSVSSAISRVDTLNNSARTFENMGFGKGETSKAMNELKKSIQGLPTPLDSAVKGMTALSATYGDVNLGQKIFSSLNNAILGFGGSAAEVDNAVMQLSQLPMDGPLDAQTWNSLRNSGLTPVLSAMSKESGMSMSAMKEAFGKGQLTVKDFTDKLIEMNKNGGGGLKSLEKIAKDSTSGIGTGISNMKTAVARGMANVIESVNKALKNTNLKSIANIFSKIGTGLENALSKFATSIPGVVKFVGDLYEKIQPFIPLITTIVAYISTYQATMKVAKTAVKMYTAVQTTMNAVMAANPIGLVIAAIVLLVAGFIYLWNTSEEFRNFWIGLWDGIKKTVSNIGTWFKDTWNGVVEWFKSLWNGIATFFSDLWEGIKESVSGAVDSVKNAWSSVKSFFSNIWNGIKKTAVKIWDSITDKVSVVFGNITKTFDPLINWFSGLWESIKSIAGSAWELIKTVIMGPILLLIDLVTGNFNQLKKDAVMLWNKLVSSIVNIFVTFITTITNFQKAFVETVVNLWNNIVTRVTDLWNGFKKWISDTTKAIVDGIVIWWNNLKQGTIDAYNAAIKWVKDAWSNFKQWISDTTKSIVNGISNGWNNLKQWTIDAFNALVDGAKTAWNNLIESVKNTIDKVVKVFNFLKNIDLLEIGRAIIDGFVKGLKAAWEAGKKFIGGIGDWIREHKGPIRKDRKLLTPAGNAIMTGLNSGLTGGFRNVQSNVSGMGDMIANAINSDYSVDIGANVAAANRSISSQVSHDVNLNQGKQPALFNVKLGNQNYKAFVDDISNAQGQAINLNMEF